jgi:hypothetical protein
MERMEWNNLNTTACIEHGLGLPEDLRDAIEETTLVRLVFGSLQALGEDTAHCPPPSGKPRIILAILLFSYTTGLYGSEEIESRINRDTHLMYLSARLPVSARELRQFRRYHRPFLERGVARLLQSASETRLGGTSLAEREFNPDESFLRAAKDRINRAVLADTMALDV